MKKLFPMLLACVLGGLFVSTPAALAQGTAFTYQGRLHDGGAPASGIYDLRFALFDALSGGAQQGATLTNAATAVSNGLFTVALDFGNQFFGAARWLEIGVRTNGGGAFNTLSPRQQLTATPYAVQAASATTAATANSVAAANVSGTLALEQLPASLVTNNSAGVNLTGTFSGSGAALTSLNASQLASGTVPDARLSANVSLLGNTLQTFIGTNVFTNRVGLRSSQPLGVLEIQAGADSNGTGDQNAIALAYRTGGYRHFIRTRHNTSPDNGNAIDFFVNTNSTAGGSTAPGVSNVLVMTLGGTGRVGIGTNNPQSALHVLGTVTASGGFAGNLTSGTVADARLSTNVALRTGGNTFSGPQQIEGEIFPGPESTDQLQTNAVSATNVLAASGWQSFTAGQSGYLTKIEVFLGGNLSGGTPGTIQIYTGEGTNGTLLATEPVSVGFNFADQTFSFSQPPPIQAGNQYTARLTAVSNVWFFVVPGNLYAGGRSDYSASGDWIFKTFVQPSSYGVILTANPANSGNVGIGTNDPQAKLHLVGDMRADGRAGIGVPPYQTALSLGGPSGGSLELMKPAELNLGYQFLVGSNGLTICERNVACDLISIANGSGNVGIGVANPTNKLHVLGGATFTSGAGSGNQTVRWTPGNGSWSFTSDRATKDRVAPVSPESVLDKVTRIPIHEWSYIGYAQRHIGPMAQDFHAQFPLNENDTALNDADLHGVALAAIQGLNQKLTEREASLREELKRREAENAELQRRLETLERLVTESLKK